MRFPDLSSLSGDALQAAGAYLGDLLTPNLRIGVTGLSRAGKTVFITALIRNLVSGGQAAVLRRLCRGPAAAARTWSRSPTMPCRASTTKPTCERLAADPPHWPDSTRHISELRVAIDIHGRKRPCGAQSACRG